MVDALRHLFKTMWWLLIFYTLLLISGFFDASIVIWNPLETDETKQKRFLPLTHSDWVHSLSFSPDGQFLASACSRDIIIWSTEVRNLVKNV